ncbi:MAG: ABC transporter ATP-binding protein [Actinomycetota bacterium]|nr:ABC transporter ATP-binding protein [Actinomycetota bacterium]
MLKLAKYLKPYTLQIIAIFIFVFGQVMADLQLPDYMAKIVNKGIVGANTRLVFTTGFAMLIVALLGAACTVAIGFLAARVATGFSMDLRAKVFDKVERFSLAEFDKFSTASLITRSTNDVQQIQMAFVMLLRLALYGPIMGVGAVFKASRTAPSMTWILGLVVALMMTLIVVLFAVAIPKFKRLQTLMDRVNLVTRQYLTGLRVIRAFNTQEHEEARFDGANVDLTNVSIFVNRLTAIMMPMMMLFFNLTAITTIWVGSHLIGSGNLLIGDMIAFMQYSMQVIMAFLMISFVFILVPRASVSGQRIAEVLAIEPIINDPADPLAFSEDQKGLVEFRDVTFSYPGADTPVLENISFTAEPGETTAFIGSTGSGKSTLINLIPRFYDVTGGRIFVDGVDIRIVAQEALRARLGYIPQKGVLFSGTIAGNIKYGAPDAGDEAMRRASGIAQAQEFIDELEEGFATPIAQGGTNVSGGQKQRLSIARAIIKKPEIYIFDDSFSALDFKTDAALREALHAEIKEATVLIVAQRISTIMNADKIIVLDEGRMVGMGRHKELMEDCPIYKEIALSQLSEEELELERV